MDAGPLDLDAIERYAQDHVNCNQKFMMTRADQVLALVAEVREWRDRAVILGDASERHEEQLRIAQAKLAGQAAKLESVDDRICDALTDAKVAQYTNRMALQDFQEILSALRSVTEGGE